MQTDLTVPHSGISISNMDINPYTNNTLFITTSFILFIMLLSEDNGETIKHLVREYRTVPSQGV